MNSLTLEKLYEEYDIVNLPCGIVYDKLGDVYEDYCASVLSNKLLLEFAKSGTEVGALDFNVFKEINRTYGICDFTNILNISATTAVPHRPTHGLSKTDVIETITYDNGSEISKAISCKQSSAAKVAFAEFDVDTICREVEISDERLIYLLLKHQKDASAKLMSDDEKRDLRIGMAPIARRFVRWVITGSPEENPTDLIYPTAIIKFNTNNFGGKTEMAANRDFSLQSYKCYTTEEYLDTIMTKNGKLKRGGFGTGLSWTYATGSKGVKIQFKG